ncbi:hypothetical protein [Roseiterribacter gracilis]|uniref:hypothetical protein n=1 Tax=Roseiterribacter gracilis TaxID=2812848 RepID=UPI003B4318A3
MSEVAKRSGVHVSTIKRARAIDAELDAAISRRKSAVPAGVSKPAEARGELVRLANAALLTADRDELLALEKNKARKLAERVEALIDERDRLEAQIQELHLQIAEFERVGARRRKPSFVPANSNSR